MHYVDFFDADALFGSPGKSSASRYNLVAIGYLVGNCQLYVNRQLSKLKVYADDLFYADYLFYESFLCVYADDLFYSSKFICRRILQSSSPDVAIVNTFCNCFNRQYL